MSSEIRKLAGRACDFSWDCEVIPLSVVEALIARTEAGAGLSCTKCGNGYEDVRCRCKESAPVAEAGADDFERRVRNFVGVYRCPNAVPVADGAMADALNVVNEAANRERHAGNYAAANALVRARGTLYKAAHPQDASGDAETIAIATAFRIWEGHTAYWRGQRNARLWIREKANELVNAMQAKGAK